MSPQSATGFTVTQVPLKDAHASPTRHVPQTPPQLSGPHFRPSQTGSHALPPAPVVDAVAPPSIPPVPI
jgi:hypothetical protein